MMNKTNYCLEALFQKQLQTKSDAARDFPLFIRSPPTPRNQGAYTAGNNTKLRNIRCDSNSIPHSSTACSVSVKAPLVGYLLEEVHLLCRPLGRMGCGSCYALLQQCLRPPPSYRTRESAVAAMEERDALRFEWLHLNAQLLVKAHFWGPM